MKKTKKIQSIIQDVIEGRKGNNEATIEILALFRKQNEQFTIPVVSGGAFWNDDKVIDFVNWYIQLNKLDFRYTLENRTIIESFKNGDMSEHVLKAKK